MKITEHRFAPSGGIPNHPELPALVVADAFEYASSGDIQARFHANRWSGTWVWTVFDYHHFHPDAHEALGVVSGHATLHLGGPEGETVLVRAGDLLLLPAGTGKKRQVSSEDFQVVGAYPPGQADVTTLRGDDGGDDIRDTIRAVPLPETDPLGEDEALLARWR
ncbi:cupin [Litorisediminicola beolgyonensis]|uniref:Cupin n=2 Tax=Litorisediminicola beolgyonensis TaxID=1173614 RepID=A0ABW3ZNG5_9RHOB